MSDRKGHRGRFRIAEGVFRYQEHDIAARFHRGKASCTIGHDDLYELGHALGKLKEQYDDWLASGETDQRALDDGKKVIYMAEQTFASLKAKYKTRCVKAT